MEDNKVRRRRKKFMRSSSIFRCFGRSADVAASVPEEHRPIPLETARSGVSDVGSSAASSLSASSSVSLSSRVFGGSEQHATYGGGAGEDPPVSSLSGDEAPSVKKRRQLAKKLLRKIVRSAAFIKALQQAKGTKLPNGRSSSPPSEGMDSTAPPPSGATNPDRCSTSFCSVASTASMPTDDHLQRPLQPPKSSWAWSTSRHRGMVTSLGFLVLLTLTVMLFWGRTCAILWTSTYLVLAPRKGGIGPIDGAYSVEPGGLFRENNSMLLPPNVPLYATS